MSTRSASGRAVVALAACLGLLSCAADTSTNRADNEDASAASGVDRTGSEVDSDMAAATDAIFAEVKPDGAGCSVAVQSGPDLVFAAAYGSLVGSTSVDVSGANVDDAALSMDVETKFDIASTSKQFTGLSVELLIADGDIERSDLVGDLLPESLPATAEVTVQQLLNHTSGLIDYGDLLAQEYEEVTTQDEAIDAIAASKPATDPGKAYDYSNSNYVLLASIVETVSGEAFADFVRQRVFDPLDLDMAVRPEVASDPVAAIRSNIAVGAEWPVAWRQYGDGSVVTTPSELVRWGAQFWEQGLDAPSLMELGLADAFETEDGDRYGSGLIFGALDDGTAAIHHDGSWGGTVTDWVVVPSEKLSVAVICNAEDAISADSAGLDILEIWRG